MREALKKDPFHGAKDARPVLSVFSPEPCGAEERERSSGWLSADMTLTEFYDAYVLPVCRRTAGRDPKTVALDRTALNFWRQMTGDPPLHAIDDGTMVDFVDGYRQCEGKHGKPVQPASVQKQCRHLQFIIDRAGPRSNRRRQNKGLIVDPPAFPTVAVPETRRPPLPLDEIARWLDACDRPTRPLNLTPVQRRKWWHALITVLYNTGLRVHTATHLRWDMLGQDGWLDIPASIFKGKKRGGEFYCNEHARKAMESIRHFRTPYIFQWHDGRPPRSDSLQDERVKTWERAKICRPNNGYHGLRRACLDWLAPRNVLAARFVAGHVVSGDMLQGHYTGPRSCVPEYLDQLPQPRREKGDPGQMRLF